MSSPCRNGPQVPVVLHLTLQRPFFDAIARGEQLIERRSDSAYWRARLAGRHFDEVRFRNGRAADAPFLRLECLGVEHQAGVGYAIRLGRLLESGPPG